MSTDATSTNDWSFLDSLGAGPDTDLSREERNRRAKAKYDLATAIHRMLRTPEGALFINHLRARTIECPEFRPDIRNPAESGFFRSGENNIYRWIRQKEKEAEAPFKPIE